MDLILALIGRLLAASNLLILLVTYWLVTGLAGRRASAVGLSRTELDEVTFWLALAAVVGARLAVVLPTWSIYLRYPLDLVRIQNGLSFYGAVAGVLVIAGWLAWRRHLKVGPAVDLFAPYLALGLAVQRTGCVVRSDCFGAVAPPPWGIVFPGLTQPRYPAELVEAVLLQPSPRLLT